MSRSEPAFTPGPWKARDYTNKEGDIWIDCDSWVNPKTASCRGGTLATAHKNGTGKGSVKSNARLIAAAPELLEALAMCLRALTDETCNEESRKYVASATARAAIAKAVGI